MQLSLGMNEVVGRSTRTVPFRFRFHPLYVIQAAVSGGITLLRPGLGNFIPLYGLYRRQQHLRVEDPLCYSHFNRIFTSNHPRNSRTTPSAAKMKFFLATLLVAILVALAMAADTQKAIVVSYPEGTPPSEMDELKAAIDKVVRCDYADKAMD